MARQLVMFISMEGKTVEEMRADALAALAPRTRPLRTRLSVDRTSNPTDG